MENFVILVLCIGATVDDLLHERQRRHAVAIDILNYDKTIDYHSYKTEKFQNRAHCDMVHLMFVFGRNDSVIVKNEEDIRFVNARLRAMNK